jgi:two-component system NtrC family sensor kinase
MKASFVNNLRFKMALVFLLASLAPLGIVSAFAVRTAYQAIASIVSNQLENLAAEKQDLLERWITERNADLRVVAGSAAVESLDPKRIGPYLTLVEKQYQVYKRFVVVDDKGQVIYNSAAGAAPADERWRQQALEGKPHMSEVRLEASDQDSVFLLSVPILDEQGQPKGGVCATVSTRAIVARVLRVSLGQSGECYLVDKKGTFLAHKQPHRILKENIARSGSFAKTLSGRSPEPVYLDYRGVPVLGATRPVAGTEWYVVVEQDRDEAFASYYELVQTIAIVIGATLAGAIGLSWALASYVTAPVRALNEAAHALARGDFANAHLDARTRRRDEIGALYTAFAHMSDQLRERHALLEKRMGVTEAELRKTDARLKSTLEAAARSEHLAALGRLAAGVAHEIRTPLASLKLFLQSVQDDIEISPEYVEDYRIGMQQVSRIETTINLFLDFARPQKPVMALVDFQKLVDAALVVVRPRANQQEVRVDTAIAAQLPPVEGDAHQLSEVLVNLMVNALEEMPNGGRLRITVDEEAIGTNVSRRSGVRIDIADSGPGISDEVLERLFEPFFTTKASGSGLGLAIAHGTVQRHGGSLTVATEVGRGTTFSIHLPAVE